MSLVHAHPPRHRAPLRTLVLWLTLAAGLAAAPPPAADDDRYATERVSFQKVLSAQKAGQHGLAAKLALGHEQYPLYPYFVYNDLKRRLFHFPVAEVQRFLAVYPDSYLAARLREDWLAQLAYARRWREFLDFYRPSEDVTLRCRHIVARLRSGVLEGVLADTREIWLSGGSLPDACDPAFERLYASDMMDDALLWQRIRLAMEAGNGGLARYLARRLTSARYRDLHALWATALGDPAAALARTDLADDEATREILVFAVRRLAHQGLARAEHLWRQRRSAFAFTAAEAGAVARALALAAAASDDPRRIELLDAVPEASVDAAVERYRIREGIAARAWPQLLRWTAADPVSDVHPLRWRYWRARALERDGQHERARALYLELSGERDYYGFMAADRLGTEYRFGHRPVAASAAERDALLANPGVARARELYLLEHRYQARREWFFELERMSRRELEIAATVATAWGWQNQAIFALGRAESWDDLELRFPVLHAELAQYYAQARALDPARIMAIIRSESAFVADARSPAGALGLMQLMPATARETAARIGLRLGDLRELYEPRTNIALGSDYLARMLRRFDGNFVMAAAAYNAGPHRVRQWRGETCVPADVWIDTIPFTETRRYVRRALLYAAIYEWRLGRDITRITSAMPPIPAAGAAGTADCRT